MPRKPTRKQKKAVKYLVENGGSSTAEAMREAGYSEAMIQTPQKLTEAKGFLELIEQYLPDHDLADIHRQGLYATKAVGMFGATIVDDFPTRHKFLETAYKLKGRLNPPNSDKTGDININLAIYGKYNDRHTISVPAKTVSDAVPRSDGRRIHESSDMLASEIGEGQDSSSSSD